MARCNPSPHWRLFLAVAFLVVVLDLATKELVFYLLGEPDPYGRRSSVAVIEGFFYLTTSYNTGALWGLGRAWPYAPYMFGAFSVVAALAISYWVFCRGSALGAWPALALGLVLGGSLGNGFDRVVHGHVRDFLDVRLVVYDWPIFNLADSALVVGALLLAAHAFLSPDDEPDRSQAGPSGPAR